MKELIKLGESYFHETKVTTVTWTRPPDRLIKINNNGSAL